MFDLTQSASDTELINGAYFYGAAASATGTGLIDSFVRLNTNTDVEQGYNTDYRPLQYDEDASWTHALAVSQVPQVDLFGNDVMYKEILLDINQSGSSTGRLISLDTLKIYQASTNVLAGYPTGWGDPIYQMGADDYVLLNASLNSGSGSGDMFLYVPASLFGAGGYVYLYSVFGMNNPNTGGFEEWAVRIGVSSGGGGAPPVVPIPAGVILGFLGLSVTGWKLRRFA